MSDSAEVILSVGSNCGDRQSQVSAGTEWLKRILSDVSISTIYSTGDCHGGPRDYYNAVVKGKTSIDSNALDNLCKEYEVSHGRTPESRRVGDVPIDIDIVVYDNEIVRPNDFRRDFFQIGYRQIHAES